MMMRFLLGSFFILGLTFVAQAQLQKGSWMVNGMLRQDNVTLLNERNSMRSNFTLIIAPEVSLMVTDHLMLGGKLEIEMAGESAVLDIPVAQHLSVRHYFKRMDKFFLFYGGEYVFEKQTTTFRGGGNRIIKRRSAHLHSGFQLFLQQAVALEFLFDYQMINTQIAGRSFRSTESGRLHFLGRLQFFIHKKRRKNLITDDFRFDPGDWLIGGNFELGGVDVIKPEVHRFWGRGWTTGVRLEARLDLSTDRSFIGLSPLVRKYFRLEKKGKLWLQAGTGVSWEYARAGTRTGDVEWLKLFSNLSVEGTIGWSNVISPNFTLDFFITRVHKRIKLQGVQRFRENRFLAGIILSGLLPRKNN